MERRTFLKWATHGLGAMFAAVLGVPAIAYVLDPLRRPGRASQFRSTGVRLNELEVSKPKQAVLRDIRKDAWTLHPNDVIGRVWLVRRDERIVQAYTTICPHLGCSINYEEKDQRFVCPCHNGTFDLQCQLVLEPGRQNPAPRGMDSLQVQPLAAPEDFLRVEYKDFRQGSAEKIEKA